MIMPSLIGETFPPDPDPRLELDQADRVPETEGRGRHPLPLHHGLIRIKAVMRITGQDHDGSCGDTASRRQSLLASPEGGSSSASHARDLTVQRERKTGMAYKSILVPIDTRHRSSWERALPQAIELAAASQGTVTVLTVITDPQSVLAGAVVPFEIEFLQPEAYKALKIIVAAYRCDVPVMEQVRFGSVAHEILSSAREQGTDLIVMESHRSELRDHPIGPNVSHVAKHADCSVLILRHPEG
jgi:nucleotide-binding universal stress UspA family protein